MKSIIHLTMSRRLEQTLPELRRVRKLKPSSQKKFVCTCDKEILYTICEVLKNIIKRRVPVKPAQLKKIRRHRKSLSALVLKKTSLKQKRKILQKGGVLGALLPAIVSVLGNLFGG